MAPGLLRFNGAASVRTRKYGKSARHKGAVLMLQWGRVGEDAEVENAKSIVRMHW